MMTYSITRNMSISGIIYANYIHVCMYSIVDLLPKYWLHCYLVSTHVHVVGTLVTYSTIPASKLCTVHFALAIQLVYSSTIDLATEQTSK